MTTQLSAYADPQAEAAGAVSAVVASLPVSFRPAAAAPDVVAVAGHAGWTGRAANAIGSGAKGVVVSVPEPEDTAQLAAVAACRRCGGGTRPAMGRKRRPGGVRREHARCHRAALSDAVLLDSVAVAAPGTDPLNLLAEQFGVLLQCGIEVQNVRMVQRNGNGYTVSGALAGGVPVALQGILTSALPATATVSILTSTGRADVVLPDPEAAWPAEIRTVTAEGATTLPTLYESSHRTSWSRVHSHLSSGTPANDLAQFTAVMSLLRQLTN